MELYNLSPAAGSTKEAFRKGRGHGSGNGKTGGQGPEGPQRRRCPRRFRRRPDAPGTPYPEARLQQHFCKAL